MQARFAARDVLQGRSVTLSDGQAGTAHGVAEDGALLVHTAQGMVEADQVLLADAGIRTDVAAIRDALARWPQGMLALWYPIKLRRALQQFYRKAAALDAKSALLLELLVRPDDSPLRMNGSGMLLLNPPWQFDRTLAPALEAIRAALGEAGAAIRLAWLRTPP